MKRFRRFLSGLLAALALTAAAQETKPDARRLKAWDLIAKEQFAEAREVLRPLSLDGNAEATLLLELIGDRPNRAVQPKALTDWINLDDEALVAAVKQDGAESLIEVFHDEKRFRPAGMTSLLQRSRDAKISAHRLALSQGIVDFLDERPWVWFTERGVMLANHHDALVQLGRLDDALLFLTRYCLPRRARLCLVNEDEAPDDPETWRFMGESRMSPIDMLLNSLAETDRCAEFAARLKDCREPEAQFLRQLCLLCAGDSSETAAYVDALAASGAVLYKEAGGAGLQDQYLLLLGRYAENNEVHDAAAICYERAFRALPPGRDEQAKLLLGSMVRALNQEGSNRTDRVQERLIANVFHAEADVGAELQRYVLRLGRTAVGRAEFDAALATSVPAHPLVRVPMLDARLSAGQGAQARELFDQLWREASVHLLAESEGLPGVFPSPRAFVDHLLAGDRFGETLREASPDEARSIAQQIGRWSLPGTNAVAQADDPAAAWLDLCMAGLVAHPEGRRLRYPAFQGELLQTAEGLLPRLRDPVARKTLAPRFLLPADTLNALGLAPIPGVQARPDQTLRLGNIAQPLPVEVYLDSLSSNELEQVENALPEGSGLRYLTAVRRGAPVPPGDPGLTYSWLTAKGLLESERIHDLLNFLKAQPERREMPGLLFLADGLIAARQTTAARFVLSLGADETGDPLERLERVKRTSRKLADLGLYPDAIEQWQHLMKSPLPRLQAEGRRGVLGYEKEWLNKLPPAEVKQMIDERLVRLERRSDDIELIEQIVRMYIHQRQFEAAARMLEQRAALQPDNPSPHIRLAVFRHRMLKEPEDAWLDFLKAYEISPRSWIDSGQVGLIHEVALSKQSFLERLGKIKLLPTDETPRTASQLYNVIDRSMRTQPVRHPEHVLKLVDTLLAFPRNPVAKVIPRLKEFRVKLLLQLGRKTEGRLDLSRLFEGDDGPTWDMRLTPEGPQGLAASYLEMFGLPPRVKHPVWAPLLEAWHHERKGRAAEAAASYKQVLDAWPNPIAEQVPILLHQLSVVEPGAAHDAYLLNQLKVKNVGRPDVMSQVVRHLLRRGQARIVSEALGRVVAAKGLTEAGRQRVRVMQREARFALEQGKPPTVRQP